MSADTNVNVNVIAVNRPEVQIYPASQSSDQQHIHTLSLHTLQPLNVTIINHSSYLKAVAFYSCFLVVN